MAPTSRKPKGLVVPYLPDSSSQTQTTPIDVPWANLSPIGSPNSSASQKRKAEDDEDKGDKSTTSKKPRKTFRAYAEHKKHEKHWYPDGNLLLQVGDIRFKVHWSRLVEESLWFKELQRQYEGNPVGKNLHAKEVESVMNESDTIGDDPLFFLDAAESSYELPSAKELEAFLTAIYSGIDYVFTPPTMGHIRLLYGAAWYYNADKYLRFANKFLEETFFPKLSAIQDRPSVENAVQAICMGDRFPDFEEVVSRALHDLARTPTATLETFLSSDEDEESEAEEEQHGGKDGAQNTQRGECSVGAAAKEAGALTTMPSNDMPAAAGNVSRPLANDGRGDKDEDDEYKDYDKNPITKISSKHFTCVLLLQRQLSSAWDPILKDLVTVTCEKSCGVVPKILTVIDTVQTVKATYPSDPLLGIQKVSADVAGAASSVYCKHMKATMKARLAARKEEICKNIEEKWTPQWCGE